MEEISEALNLTLFGMGFVFTFLVILVFVMSFMSKILNKNKKKIHNDLQINNISNEIDEEAEFVISQAIKMHRGKNV